MRGLLLGILISCLAGVAQAGIVTFEFESEEQRQRFYQLGNELRCPKCQNQNIADSDAPIAEDLRNEVFRLLSEGHDNREIIDYMVMRYGDFVRYRPAFNAQTAALWLAPGVFLFGAIGILVFMLIRRRGNDIAADQSQLSEAEQQQLHKLLKEKGE
ncbi:cytochrome c-type biogenesis protein [Halopseudomonas yangmingensis]|uniref:Cytochrome c-type biogenesis protein n=1 Tax=Halopseudomonas yangmingensis TaxID=1720063 RepID=A0A1I4NFM3_9GAMM|nr:cytochrome c-type biogenesis protein [Halopseudomonas yangmingensis]SFM14080.1 cytochrome c-type biogenesis protein CcmH [Halopseudomonas yangmingensis]